VKPERDLPAPRYVPGVADRVPPNGPEYRVRRVGELVDMYGRYGQAVIRSFAIPQDPGGRAIASSAAAGQTPFLLLIRPCL